MTSDSESIKASSRVASIDQLRGYAIFGMLLVNARFLFFEPAAASLEGTRAEGLFDAVLYQLAHHRTEFTYADTIAPLFVFVVGMGMRHSSLRRSQTTPAREIRKSLAKRYALLVLIGFALYTGWVWDALTDIGLAGLLAIPFIDKKPSTRLIAAFAFVAVYQCIHMFTSYGVWSVHGVFSLTDPEYVPLPVKLIPLNHVLFDANINGGPLGPLSWVMMLLFGTYALDLMNEKNHAKFLWTCLAWGVGLCAAGWVLHIEWPGLKGAWPISAYHMTAPFPLWATGLCFFQLLAFRLLCDWLKLRIPTFTSVGMNPLVLYIAQSLILNVAHGFVPNQFSLLTGLIGFAIFWGFFAAAAYYMHRKHIYIKI